jgi:hypothetical protein
MISQFTSSLHRECAEENEERRSLVGAVIGAAFLRSVAADGFLSRVFRKLMQTDHALHGLQDSSFLSQHMIIAGKRIGDVQSIASQSGEEPQSGGTGGGGVQYLATMGKRVIPLFPALLAMTENPDDEVPSWL